MSQRTSKQQRLAMDSSLAINTIVFGSWQLGWELMGAIQTDAEYAGTRYSGWQVQKTLERSRGNSSGRSLT